MNNYDDSDSERTPKIKHKDVMNMTPEEQHFHMMMGDISLQIIKKYSCRTEDEEHDTSRSEISERDFDNLDAVAISPRLSPPCDGKKLEQMERELSLPRVRLSKAKSSIFFLLHCVLCFKLCCTMHIKILDNGGFYFFIPLAICMICIGAPLVFLELALGQFTSQLSVAIFSRMSPILIGISYSMVLMRSLMVLSMNTEHRFCAILWEAIGTVLFGQRTHFCSSPADPNCFLDVCRKHEVFYQGACYDYKEMYKNNTLSLEWYHLLATRHSLQQMNYNGRYVMRFVSKVERVFGYNSNAKVFEYSSNAHFVDAVFVIFLICTIFAKMGIRKLAKISTFIVCCYPVVFVCVIAVFMATEGYRMQFHLLVQAVASDPSKLLESNTWFNALLTALVSLSVGDGTLHSIGAMHQFNHNIFRDVVVLVSVVFSTLFSSTFIFGIISIIGIQYRNKAQYSMRDLTADVIRKILNRYESEGSYVDSYYYFLNAGKWSKILTLIICVFSLFTQVAAHALIAENLISTVLRLWPALMKVNARVVRHCVIVCHFLFIALVYFALHRILDNIELTYVVSHIALLAVVVWECYAVATHYTINRLLVNIYTMFAKDRHLYLITHRLSWIFYLLWTYVVPLICAGMVQSRLVSITREFGITAPVVFVIIFSCMPIFFAARMVAVTLASGGSVPLLLRPQPTWGPFSIKDKMEVNFDERAARILL